MQDANVSKNHATTIEDSATVGEDSTAHGVVKTNEKREHIEQAA
jgi:hypothetical protein